MVESLGRVITAALVVAFGISAALVTDVSAGRPSVTRIVYDSFNGNYDLDDYLTKWNNGFGPGEMALDDTREFDGSSFSVSALPFQTAADFSVFDHIKYLALSNQSFAVPEKGSVAFSTTNDATVAGTQPQGRSSTACTAGLAAPTIRPVRRTPSPGRASRSRANKPVPPCT